MEVTQPFARITTATRLLFFRSLEDAFKASEIMIEPHKIWARDKERQSFVVVSDQWTPERERAFPGACGGTTKNQPES